MKREIIYIVLFFFSICGCINRDKIQINSKNIVFIEIYKIENHKLQFVKKINDAILIKEIVNTIENSRKETIKFVPKFVLIFHSKTEIFSVAVNGKSMSYRKGFKYILEDDIEKILIDNDRK